MGIPLTLQAVPNHGHLLTRLRTDRRLGTLFGDLYSMGGGPYTWAEMDDLDDSLLDLVGRGIFASRDDAEKAFADLIAKWGLARASHPGLGDRRAFLDRTRYDLEERITRQLRDVGDESSAELIGDLFHGETRLRSWSVGEYDPLRLISAARVKAIADVLLRLDCASLFDEDEQEWLGEDYRELKQLCWEAAKQGEAVIVGA